MEIERKYLLKNLPGNLNTYPHHIIEQGYVSTNPVIRIRRFDDEFILTMKSSGLLAREEYEMNIDEQQYNNLISKIEGNLISKTRYIIPTSFLDNPLKIELDIFHKNFHGLILAEIEFPSLELAKKYNPPTYFSKEVTYDSNFYNSTLSNMDNELIKDFIATIPTIFNL